MGDQSKLSKFFFGDMSRFSLSNNTTSLLPMTQVVYREGVSSGRQDFDPMVAIKEGFKLNPTFFAGVDKIAKNVDLVEWVVEVETTSGWERDTKHELNKILRLPDPRRKLSFDGLTKASIIFLNVGGNFIWYKVRTGSNNTGKVWRWELLPLASIKPIINTDGYIDHYEYAKDKYTTLKLKPSDIIHGKEFDPADPNWGLSKLKVLSQTVDTDNAAQSWNLHSMDNRGVPDGAWVYSGDIEQEEYDEMYDDLQEQFTGVKNARKPMLLTGSVEWVSLGATLQEMDYLNSRKFNANQIAKVLGVPAPLLGDMDSSTYNNVEQFKKSLWEDAIIPHLNLIMDTINVDLQEEYKDEKQKVRINYSLANVPVMREDYGAKLDSALKMRNLGIALPEINRILDLGLSEESLINLPLQVK